MKCEAAMTKQEPLRVEIWSDIVCPFCWIGKRHFEEAVSRLGVEEKVEVVHRAYQLNPGMGGSRPLVDYLAQRFGSEAQARAMTRHVSQMGEKAGLKFDFEHAIAASTRDAHRLVKHAAKRGLADALVERLMRGHFDEREDLGDEATLLRLANQAGVDAEEAARVLRSEEHLREVEQDSLEAQAMGARGVPFFVLDRRYGVAGAQPVEAFMQAIEQALALRSEPNERAA